MVAIQEGPDTFKEKGLKTKWPVVEGTTAGTTKQTKERFLKPTEKSYVSKNDKVGLNY